MKFSLSSFIGFFVSLVVLLLGSFATVGVIKVKEVLPAFLVQFKFLDFPSFFVIIGGMLCGLFVMYPAFTVFKAIGSIKSMFSHYSGKLEVLEEEIKNIMKYKEELEANRPILLDGVLQILGKKDFNELTTVQGRYVLRTQILDLANEMSKRKGRDPLFTNVYFTHFIVQ